MLVGMRFALVLVLAACGPSTKPAAQQPPPPPQNSGGISGPAVVDFVTERRKLCDRAKTFRDDGCRPFDRVDPSLLEDCSVVGSIYISTIEQCMFETSCDDLRACSMKVREEGGTYRGPTAACKVAPDAPELLTPAGVSTADIETSYGRKDKTFADSPSSLERPIEVCGMPDEAAYLTRLTCTDGSKPFANRGEAADSRTGNAGVGGRCGRMIDRYAVTCPEKRYEVFIDAYRCPG